MGVVYYCRVYLITASAHILMKLASGAILYILTVSAPILELQSKI